MWLTVDTAVLGRRERDVRRGMTLPPKIGPGTIIDGAIHPAWTWDFLRNEPITFANVVGLSDEDGSSAVTLSEHMARQFDPALSWDDVEWLRSVWDGPIVLKGIQTVADAKRHGIQVLQRGCDYHADEIITGAGDIAVRRQSTRYVGGDVGAISREDAERRAADCHFVGLAWTPDVDHGYIEVE